MAPGHRAGGPRLESHRSGCGIAPADLRVDRREPASAADPVHPGHDADVGAHASRWPDAVTLRCHLAWRLVAMLIVLTGQLAPKRHRPLCRLRLRGSGAGQARVEQTAHRMAATARGQPGSRRTPGLLQGLLCSLVPVCSSTPPTPTPTARDAMQRAGVGTVSSGSFRDPRQMSASILQAGAVRSAP
jgi:hypothetical protein